MADKKTLIAKRGLLKATLTRFATFVNDVSNHHKTIELSERASKIEKVYDDFNEIQTAIELMDASENQLQERDDFDNKYFSLISVTKQIIKDNEQGAASIAAQPISQNMPMNAVQSAPQVSCQLPPISLPLFDGSYDKWSNFFDIYSSLIHNNSNLAQVQKFHYLQSVLRGEALKIIDSLEISDQNYLVAIELLKNRFENKKHAIRTHLKHIFELESVQRESHTALRNFLDTFSKHYRCLLNLGETINASSSLLIYLLLTKLDTSTKREWEIKTKDVVSPKIDDFIKFLDDRCSILESIDTKNQDFNKRSSSAKSVHIATNKYNYCGFCKSSEHNIAYCESFLKLNAFNRYEKIKSLGLCTNCLRKGHNNRLCTSKLCNYCAKKHHSLLHFESKSSTDNKIRSSLTGQVTQDNSRQEHVNVTNDMNDSGNHMFNTQVSNLSCSQNIQNETSIVNCSTDECSNYYTLLSTAKICIYDSNNKPIVCKALLDSASQSSFMSTELFESLNLPYEEINMPIIGINSNFSKVTKLVKTKIHSSANKASFDITCFIINKITDDLPQHTFDTGCLNIPEDIKLADPDFNYSAKIDILIGAGMFYELLLPNQIKLGRNRPILQASKLGFILGGNLCASFIPENFVCNLVQNSDQNKLESQLESFWKIEECTERECTYTKEESECEQHFIETFRRSEDGHFVVKLPFNDNVAKLGDSSRIAINRFHKLEQKLSRNSNLKLEYSNFLKEYEEMGHMTPLTNIGQDFVNSNKNFYLPHHCVLKDSSLTTKLRVVFNASAKTNTDLSLNDVLKTGPCIQQPLFSILLRFRSYKIVFTADVSKMYRCILVDQADRDYQRIVWRPEASQKLNHFQLNTVTYGTSPASFLATRCLKQLSLDIEHTFPEAAKSIAEDFYMDDWLSGTNDIDSAVALIKNVNDTLHGAHFDLRQWSSNDLRILQYVGEQANVAHNQYFVKENENNKTLGIMWNSSKDEFSYIVNTKANISYFTKRIILSIISQIYDILGLLGPIIIKAKIILQKLWLAKLDWDTVISDDILESWLRFYKQLPLINNLRIPRYVGSPDFKIREIHCFSDASIVGYGTAIYIRSENDSGDIVVSLACAKSRVAPLKTLTLPRLELCGCVLAVQLCNNVLTSLNLNSNARINVYYWTDSQIVLAWLKHEPSTLKTFVSNRISKIQRFSRMDQWSYVPSNDNPADLISRGLDPNEILENTFWFRGPTWLSLSKTHWPNFGQESNFHLNLPEIKASSVNVIISPSVTEDFKLLFKYSSYRTLLHVTAYILRFKTNTSLPLESRNLADLTINELDQALYALIRVVQITSFSIEVKTLKSLKSLSSKSTLLSLNPFLDKDGLLRVGGRLTNSQIEYSAKHPIILPAKHHFTYLLIRHEHLKNLHAGPQLILSNLRQRFWPLRGRQTVRDVLRKCITCFKVAPSKFVQKMADLPSSRVTPTERPFVICGVDYAGPYQIKDSKFRNRKFIKAYICIFVCFTTKAVHVEVVSDLSTEGFLNAFKRFISRRGLCSHVYSDCGTNFVSADKILSEVSNRAKEPNFKEYLLENKIQWHFSPPRSPHFGGLWESAVRMAKYHLKRVTHNLTFTYEDFYSICVQVESILNSRPLYPLTEEPEDYETITPGHFLIGASLKAVPELPVWNATSTHVSRYRHMQFVIQQFWSHWSRNYLQTLQGRSKWKVANQSDLAEGKLVLLHEDNVPPMCWRLGRIAKLHPGADGLVRVVLVKTKNGLFKRSVHKLSVLPVEVSN